MNKKLRDEKEYLIATRRKRGSASQSDSSKSRQSGKARRTSSETGSQASSNANRICQNCGRTDSPESVLAGRLISPTRLDLLTRWSADGEVDRTATRRFATRAVCGGQSLKSRARAAVAPRATVRSRRLRPRSLLSLRSPSLRRNNNPGRQPRARRHNPSWPRSPRSRRISRSTPLSDACTYMTSYVQAVPTFSYSPGAPMYLSSPPRPVFCYLVSQNLPLSVLATYCATCYISVAMRSP